MDSKFVAFDLEIAFLGPQTQDDSDQDGTTMIKVDSDWKQYRPFGITCAGLAWVDGENINTTALHGWEFSPDDETPAPRMSKAECRYMVKQLQQLVQHDYTLLSWNGLGFDFDVLGEESGLVKECAELAMHHVDMMFHFFCIQGYPLGLDTAAKGMHLPGKSKDVSGAEAPQLWADGQFQSVLNYVQQDVRTTLQVAHAVEHAQGLSWTARSGKLKYVNLPSWLTVEQAMHDIRVPNTRWMGDRAWPRSKFYGWAKQALQTKESVKATA